MDDWLGLRRASSRDALRVRVTAVAEAWRHDWQACRGELKGAGARGGAARVDAGGSGLMRRYRRSGPAAVLVFSTGGEFRHRAVQVGDVVGRGLVGGPHRVSSRPPSTAIGWSKMSMGSSSC